MSNDFEEILKDLESFSEEDYITLFKEIRPTIDNRVIESLEYDESFDFQEQLSIHGNITGALNFLYQTDSHMLMIFLIELAINNEWFIIDEYNRWVEQFKEDPSVLESDFDLDFKSLDELYEYPYIHMHDVKVFEIRTKNYKYQFEFSGDFGFEEIGLHPI